MNACYEICSRTLTPISWQYVGPQFPSGAPRYVIRDNLKTTRHALVVLRNTRARQWHERHKDIIKRLDRRRSDRFNAQSTFAVILAGVVVSSKVPPRECDS